MSHAQIAEKWLEVEGRRRANFKQQIQDLEHGGDIDQKGRVEVEIENLLKKSGNPWGVNLEDVSKDLFMTPLHPHGWLQENGVDGRPL